MKIEQIFKEVKSRGIKIYPFQKERIFNSKKRHIISLPHLKKLTDIDLKKYLYALWNIQNENAGGYDGWTTAHKTFKEMGFVKTERRQGFRVFTSYSYKNENRTKV